MHKRLFNELALQLTLAPTGPLLIKAGDRGGMDPTRPDMEFVRTWYNGRETIYLPGSSLKGLVRAHAEKIARTVTQAEREAEMTTRLTCNPLKADYKAVDGSCGEKFHGQREKPTAEEAYRCSCFVCQIFGNTELAGRLRFADAYPPAAVWDEANQTEVRHGVAIDRVYGSVAVGPFQFETATGGKFTTTLTMRNFTVAQLGLLALTLRDLRLARLNLGFAKSRGLGRVALTIDEAIFRYPMGEILPGVEDGVLPGVGALLHQHEAMAAAAYGYQPDDLLRIEGLTYSSDEWLGRQVLFDASAAKAGGTLDGVWKASVQVWKKVVLDGRE